MKTKTIATADEPLRLESAHHKHRENLRAIKKYSNSKLKKAGAAE